MAKNKEENTVQIRSLDADFFYSDIEMSEALSAVLIRSPSPSGTIKSITIDELPEGYYLFSAADIPGKKYFEINKTPIKIFASDNISYTGEPVGILCGPDEHVLKELLEKININFNVQSLESALKNVINNQKIMADKNKSSSELSSFVSQLNDMPSLDTVLDKTHVEQNVEEIIASRVIKTGKYKKSQLETADKLLFKNLPYIVEQKWCLKQQAPNWEETTGAFCFFSDNIMYVYTPTRWVNSVMEAVSDVIKIPKENVDVHKTKVSGIYSKGLQLTTQLTTQVAVAAYLTNKPVKLIFTQDEEDMFLAPGIDATFTYKTGLSKEGELVAMNINIEIDAGSSNPFAQEITDRLAIASCNYYSCKNLYINAYCHTSKKPPTSINIKNVESQAFFAIENQIQSLSQLSQFYPDEIRKLNITRIPSFPFHLNNENRINTFERAIKISDFNRKYASFHMDAIDRTEKGTTPFFALPLRGIGLASGYNVSDYYGQSAITSDCKVTVTLQQDNKVIIHAIKPSSVIQEMWKETVMQTLQIKKDNIYIDSDFLINEITSAPDDSLSSIGTMNELIKKCCLEIQKKRFHNPLPISSQKGLTSSTKKIWDKDKFQGNPYGVTSFATTVVEVEVDSYTFSEKIKGIWMTIDCGELFDESAALRTVRLEIQQELEMLVEDKNIPCDNINIEFMHSTEKSGQIGGLVHNTLPAAFAAALSHALITQLTMLPCTEKQLFELIKEREKQKNKSGEKDTQ